MLSAASTRHFGSSTLRSTIFLEREFRVHLVTRDRLLFDSKFSPPSRRPVGTVHIYASLCGSFARPGAAATTGPQAFALAESEFDCMRPSSPSFRSWGEPCTIVELRILETAARCPVGLANGPLSLPDAVWDAYAALGPSPDEAAVRAVIHRLAEANIVASSVTSSIVEQEPERFARLWSVMRPLYEELATSASLKQIATIARLSLRQLGRDLGDLSRTFGLFGSGFRDAMRVLRLRAAVLLLSAPGGTPSDVSKAVGYGSLDAMGRAFRDANLPAPSVVQDLVRFPA